jgi:DNA-binding NtrC family response regulator
VLQFLSQNSYDLLITDIKMPGLSGIELIQSMHKSEIKIPIIVITVIPDQKLIEELTELKVAKILSKPFDLNHFINLIKEVMY